ncbi:thioredoxin fold domain-containing protein [Postechiella marina]|uniref:Thioredoxin fold domain-containing protein n=1 Tax=Postechiella marina TaxID=943941 RepID=A0ABP8CEU5_9FLAO
MKKTLYVMLVLGFVTLNSIAQEINWVTFEEALELQRKTPKKIMMDVYTSWCPPCKALDKNTFHNEDVSNYVNEHYYAVKFDGEGNDVISYNGGEFTNPNYDPAKANRRNSPHQLAGYLQISAYPTIVFFDETGNVIAPIKGYQTPPQIELYLKLFKENHYKTIDSQEKFSAYAKAFKPEFKS